MPDFYIVPPRLIVGSFDRAAVVNSINSLRGDLTFTADTSTGARIVSSGNNLLFGFIPNYYVKRTGDTITGNLNFNVSGSNYGLAIASLPSNPTIGTTGAFYFNTTDGFLKLYYNNSWNDLPFAGISIGFGNTTYLRLDGTNTPTANISMGSNFLRIANLATQVSAGSVGQIYYNTDTNKVQVYNGSAWINVGSGITSISVGIGLTSTQNPITTISSLSINEAANFTWTGNHIYNQPVVFSAAGQSFDINKLFISGQSNGDLIKFESGSWTRQGIGSSYSILQVNETATGIGWTKISGIKVSNTPPTSPINADLWWNNEDGSLNIYYQDGDSDQWVEIVNAFVGFGNTGVFDPYSDVDIYSNTSSTGMSQGALTVLGGVGVGETLNAKTLGVNDVFQIIGNTYTSSNTSSNQVAHTVNSNVFRTAKYLMQITSGTDYNAIELLLMHDGSTVYMTEYGQILAGSGATLSTFDADISGGNMRLLVTPTNSTTTYKFSCSALRV